MVRLLLLALLLGVPAFWVEGGGLWIGPAVADDDGDDGDDGDNGDDGPGAVGGGGFGAGDDQDSDRGGRGSRERGGDADDDDPISDFFDSLFGDDDDSFVEGEIVALDLPANGRAALIAVGFRVLSERPLIALGGSLTVLAVPRGTDAEDALDVARSLVSSAVFDLNHVYRDGGTGCEGDACWAARVVGLGNLPAGACARGAPIAIVDTAIQVGHAALAMAQVETNSFLRPGFASAPPDHGTAIAALIVGTLSPDAAPLAPGAPLLAAEAIGLRDGQPLAEAATIVPAIDWAMSRNARVIAFSIEGAPNRLLEIGIRRGAQHANLVAAAGNGGPDGDPAFPAAYPEVMAVAAVDHRLRPYRNGTRGAFVEIAAPGVDVLSAAAGGGQRAWTGSSFAVPIVAAALLRARAETGGNPVAARSLLTGGARDLGAPGRDEVYGYGLLNFAGSRCW
ncbi:MAG: S8 family serine peptidase [Rhodospirillaceae bacterium]|nr:S8 family serine peptidase [Rhodospirillaceae bacterium]